MQVDLYFTESDHQQTKLNSKDLYNNTM